MSDETEGKLLRQGFTVVVVALIVIGAAVVLAVIALNFLGDGLRDASDPYNK